MREREREKKNTTWGKALTVESHFEMSQMEEKVRRVMNLIHSLIQSQLGILLDI